LDNKVFDITDARCNHEVLYYHSSYLSAYENGIDRVFRNVGI